MQNHAARLALRLFMPLVLTVLCLWLLARQLDPVELALIPAALQDLTSVQIALAGCFTAISLWAVGRYDALAHRHIGSNLPAHDAGRAGTVAIALSQTLGFGLLSGALARWRMLPGLSGADALRLSAFVCLTFMTSLAVLCALACILLPAPDWTFYPALAVLCGLLLLLICLFRTPQLRYRGWEMNLPTLPASFAILGWSALDTLAAAAALYVLIPSADLSFAAFLPIFLLALGAALATGSPGGLGPFELVLLSGVPGSASAPLLAGVLAFRLIYYAAPAILALIAMSRPLPLPRSQRVYPPPCTHQAPRAEIQVIRQNGGDVAGYRDGAAAFWSTGQTVTALFDPVAGTSSALLKALSERATAANRVALVYKCSAPLAVVARRSGWRTLHFADEAVLSPGMFDLDQPARRSLRRKLRNAEKAGISVTRTPDSASLARIDGVWQHQHGLARGGTMGRFSPRYIQIQRVYAAQLNGEIVAFISFHATQEQWCLDLMRHINDIPDGTMHALINAAIKDAAAHGIPTLSLAATPACPDPRSTLMRALSRKVSGRAGGPGLRQFKSNFAPQWKPLYAAAPSYGALLLGLADVAWAVHRPAPLEIGAMAHKQDEDYEVASTRAA